MNLARCCFLLSAALTLSIAAQASRLATANSSYGFGGFGTDNQTPTSTCIDLLNNSCLLTEQTFYGTDSSNEAVYDFKINSDVSNFTLSLDGNASLINYGAFVLDDSHTGNPVQYGPDATNLATAIALADGKGASFTVPGDGNGLVFFIVLDQPVLSDPPPDPANVTASVQFNGAPEPATLPILCLALVVLGIVQYRRRHSDPLNKAEKIEA